MPGTGDANYLGSSARRGAPLERFADDRDPWQRQPGESSKAYLSFVLFRDLGPSARSITQVATQTGKNRTVPQRWATQFRWLERAQLWDDAQRKQTDVVRRDEQDQAIRRHAQASNALMLQAMRVLQEQPKEGMPDGRQIQQAAIALDKAIHHNRLALGLPTDVTRQDVQLKQAVEEALDSQTAVRAVLEEHICDDCRQRVGAELRRLAAHQARLRERVNA